MWYPVRGGTVSFELLWLEDKKNKARKARGQRTAERTIDDNGMTRTQTVMLPSTKVRLPVTAKTGARRITEG